MRNFLFVGSFLSSQTGSKSVSEKLKRELLKDSINIILVSKFENKILRLLAIIFGLIFYSYEKIHIDTFSGNAFRIAEIATFFGKFRNKKIIITLRGGALPEFYENGNQERIKKLFRKSNIVQSPSLYLKNYFDNKGFEVAYLPNSINTDSFPFNRTQIIPHSLLWVRAFTKIYNPELAIKTLFIIKKQFPLAKLTMIGPDKGTLKEVLTMAEKLKLLESIDILGPVNNDKLYKYYQTHSVYLNTTSYESYGVAVMEAASCGIPVVSTSVGELPLLWENEKNILLINEIDDKMMANAVSRLFLSEDLSEKLSINAKRNSENYDWKKIKSKWLNLLYEKNH